MTAILETMKLSAGQATDMFIKLRDEKKKRDDLHKESMKKIVQAMERLEAGLIEHLNASGANSVASDAGTAYLSEHTSATVKDKEAFMQFVKDTQQWDALDIKANKTFVKEYMEDNEEVPPGVSYSSVKTVGVQRK
jgi:type I site-specific restriction endonuclease